MITRQKVNECGLSRSALPHNSYGLSSLYLERNSMKHLAAVLVCKMHVIERNFILKPFNLLGIRCLAYGIGCIQNFVHTFHRCHAFGNVVRRFGKILQGLYDAVEYYHVENKRRSIDGRMLGKNKSSPVPQNKYYKHRAKKLADRMSRGLAHRNLGGCMAIIVCAAVKTLVHLPFCRESLDYSHSAESFFELRHCFTPFVLSVKRLGFQLSPYPAHCPAHNREHNDCEQRQLPACINKNREITN